eukprot:353444-Chlamydomonas_euryale.AAC.1
MDGPLVHGDGAGGTLHGRQHVCGWMDELASQSKSSSAAQPYFVIAAPAHLPPLHLPWPPPCLLVLRIPAS